MHSQKTNNNNLFQPLEELQSKLALIHKKFSLLFQNISEEIHCWKIIKNSNGAITGCELIDVNPSALKAWKKTKEQAVGKQAKELLEKNYLYSFNAVVKDIFKTNQSQEWKYYFNETDQHKNIKSIPMGDFFLQIEEDITYNVKRENRLKESEKFVDEIFNNTYNFIGFLEPDGTLIDTNKTTLEFVGLTKEQVVGQKFYDAPWWSSGKSSRENIKESIKRCAKGEFIRYEIEVTGKNNKKIIVDFTLKPVFNDSNEVIYIIPEGRDVTEKVQVKKELEQLNTNLELKVKQRTNELESLLETLKEYKLAAELSQVGLWKWDLETDIQEWDETIYNLYGVKKGEFDTVSEACFSGIHIDDRERVKKEFYDCMNGVKSFDSIFRVVKKDTEETIHVRAKGKVDFNEDGIAKTIYGTKWDVTKELTISKERNTFAKELKQQYNLISSASLILIADHQGKIIEVNKEFCKLTGFVEKDLINKNYDVVLEDYHTPDYYLNLNSSLAKGRNWSGLLCIRKKDNSILWLQTSISPFRNTSGDIEKFVSVSFDITEQKNLELRARKNQEYSLQQSKELLKVSRELSKQKYLLQTVFDNTDFMIFLKDLDGKFILANKQLCKNLNLGKVEDVIGTSDFDYFDEDIAKEFQRKDKEIIDRGTVQTFEENIELPIGKRTFLTSKFPLFDDSYKAMGICGISIDITDKKENEIKLKETQAQLIQSEKMASLGLLTAGIAHEINNPLNFISGGYLSIQKHFEKNKEPNLDDIKKFVDWIRIGTQRATEIVRGLNDLSRDNLDYNEPCNIHKILKETLAIVHNKLEDKIKIVKDYDIKTALIHGNLGKLNQLFLNLLTNAIDAIEDEGVIYITTKENNSYVSIVIKDTGVGIDKEQLKKVIEPFFTTKPPGSGTGLGLYICSNIVKEHKGKLEISSKKGEGTSVLIKLPK